MKEEVKEPYCDCEHLLSEHDELTELCNVEDCRCSIYDEAGKKETPNL